MPILTVRVSEALHETLQEYAEVMELPLSTVTKWLLKAALEGTAPYYLPAEKGTWAETATLAQRLDRSRKLRGRSERRTRGTSVVEPAPASPAAACTVAGCDFEVVTLPDGRAKCLMHGVL